jgi:transposase-like protein
MKNRVAQAQDEGIVSLRVSEPPRPECPRCHHEHVEDLYPVIPRWLACPKCGHMWSNRTPYRKEERAKVLQTLRPGKLRTDGQ